MPISYSKLQLYRTCPKQYEFACVKKIPRQISAGESFGSSVHNTLKKWGELEISNTQKEEGQLAMFDAKEPKKEIELSSERLLQLWHQSFIVEGYNSRVDAEQARKRGEVLMQHFFTWWKQKERTVAVIEKGFTVRADGTDISGRFDRIEYDKNGVHVIDFKTGGLRTQKEVDADLQLSIYALAAEESLGMPCTKLTLLFLHEDGITERSTVHSAKQLQEAKEKISTLHEHILQKEYDPTPSKEACTRCPYSRVCDAAII